MIKNTSPPLAAEPPSIDGFTFVRPIGSGSTSNVYLYRQSGRERPVAVKVGNVARDARAAARIIHESNMLGHLPKHPNILPMLAMGTAGHGANYLVFEYASGGSYGKLLRTRTLTCGEMLDLGVTLADALCVVHRAGVVHRDIKPGNVLIGDAGEPLLADFGIACSVYGAGDAGYSIPWAAPESLTRQRPCEATDVYSLAALLYAMLAGASPFEYGYRPKSSAQLRNIVLSKPVPPLRRADVPESVESLLRRAMEKNPADRFPTMADFARELRQARQAAQPNHAVAPGARSGGDDAPLPHMPARTAVRLFHGFPRRPHARMALMLVLSVAPAALLLIALAGGHLDSVQSPGQVHVLDADEPIDLDPAPEATHMALGLTRKPL